MAGQNLRLDNGETSPSDGLKRTTLTRRWWLAAAATAAGGAAFGRVPALARQATPEATQLPASRDWRGEHWVGAWARGMHVPSPAIEDAGLPNQIFEVGGRTLRQIVRLSTGGEQVRIRLANTFGDQPVIVGAASLALRDHGEVIDSAAAQTLTFSGLPEMTIPANAIVLSDPIDLPVPNITELVISLYFPEATPGSTVHGFAYQTNYISSAGDFTMEASLPVETAMQTWVFLTGVDVAVTTPRGAIVCLGDSLTDGENSTPDTNHRWSDILADRLAASQEAMPGVLNLGIGGNRVLHNAPAQLPFAGQSSLARFDRDVLAQPGLSHLIVWQGVNDIGLPVFTGDSAETVTADQLIAGLRQLAERAHEHGIVAYVSPVPPFGGSVIYTEEGEAVRTAVNDWIRSGEAFDGVIDFEAVLRDPQDPTRHRADFDGGDNLHLNDTGHKALGESIDLGLFAAE
jgi:lysophospholipase L1-like esterase